MHQAWVRGMLVHLHLGSAIESIQLVCQMPGKYQNAPSSRGSCTPISAQQMGDFFQGLGLDVASRKDQRIFLP